MSTCTKLKHVRNLYSFVQLQLATSKQADIHTRTRVLQCSPASVGLAQARPNYPWTHVHMRRAMQSS